MNYKNTYHQFLLDHYNHARTRGTLEKADFSSGVYNPSCGDSVAIQGLVSDNILTVCRFQATGCVISGAAASLLMEKAQGQTIQTILGYTSQTMLDLVQLPLGPTRLRCALLALEALQDGIKKMSKKGIGS